ncbi:MAG: SpoIIE family protein phosphatase [Bacteroidia bacterium]|nr:SpoIIE family protein phosphatase [Bacteroidia bacterium]
MSTRLVIIIIFFFLRSISSYAQIKTLDSLQLVLKNAKADTAICDAYYRIGNYYFTDTQLIDKTIIYYKNALKVATKLKSEKRIGRINRKLAQCYRNLKQDQECLKYYLKALPYYESLNDGNSEMCNIYYSLAKIYGENGVYTYSNIYLYKILGNLNKVDKSFFGFAFTSSNNQLALNNIEQHQIDSAIYYQTKNYIYNKANKDSNNLLFDYCNLAKCYLLKKDYYTCEQFCKEGLYLAKKLKDSTFVDVELYTYLGGMYNKQGKYKQAVKTLYPVTIAPINYADYLECVEAFKEISYSYSKLKQYDSAYYYITKYHFILDDVYSRDNMQKFNQLGSNYEIDNRENKIALLNKDNEINDAKLKQQRILFYGIGIVLLLMIALALFIYKNLKAKQTANLLLQLKNDEINKAHSLLERKNELIHDSIIYAQHIQELLMPGDADLIEFSQEYFIFYQPKDFVSGDIYWINKIDNNNIIVSAVDCTGHGVPGAMMSILAYDLLEYAVNEQKITEPAAILNCIKHRIKEKLKLAIAKEFHEGMDLSLCKLNIVTNVLTYSGARNSIIVVRNNEVIELTVDRQSINVNTINDFTQSTFAMQPNDMVYLFSDGFADQKGGPNNKKVYYSKFKTILQHIASMPCDAQHEHVTVFINEWMYNQTLQIDDMMVIGFRIK